MRPREVSTVFEETCVFFNGVGGCSTIIGGNGNGHGDFSPTSPNSPTTTSTPTQSVPSTATPTTWASTDPSTPSSAPQASPSSAQPTRTQTPPPSDGNVTVPPSTSFDSTSSLVSSLHVSSSLSQSQDQRTTDDTSSGTGSTVTGTPAADSLSPTSSTPIPALTPSPRTSTFPSSTPSPQHRHGLNAGAIVGIAIGVGVAIILIMLLIVCMVRRRRRGHSIGPILESRSAGSSSNVSEPTSTTHDALLPIESESEKWEDASYRNSSWTVDASHASRSDGSMIVQLSNFNLEPVQHSLSPRASEPVPSLTTASEKWSRGAVSSSTSTSTAPDTTALSPTGTELSEVPRRSIAEMGNEAHRTSILWSGTVNQQQEDDGRPSTMFRYETDGGVRLAGGPLGDVPPGPYTDDDDRRTLATVVTLPPPYSQY